MVTKRSFYLDDPPVKLGDGSFGAVYQVWEHVGEASESKADITLPPDNSEQPSHGGRFALKVFYNRQMTTRTGLIRVEPLTFNNLANEVNDKIGDVQELSIGNFLMHIFRSLKAGKPLEEVELQAHEVLKQSERLQNVSAKRFGREREISSKIRALFSADRSVNSSEIACVQTEYDTTTFRSSEMFRFLHQLERKKGSSFVDNLSDYAIIMEQCDYTLEDVLEAHWLIWSEVRQRHERDLESDGREEGTLPTGEEVSVYRAEPLVGENMVGAGELHRRGEGRSSGSVTLPVHAKTVTGYEMLQSIPFSHRLVVIYPLMEGLAGALQMLHASRNYHHDIKPGNVFLKTTRNDFSVALGDFSFVGSGVDEGTTEAVLRDSIQTGSLHFRSPEQRDFNDAAYGVVHHSECCKGPGPEYKDQDVSEEGWAYVRIADPKFRDSTIGESDVVVFPADRSGTGYRIVRVCSVGNHRDVWLKVGATEFKRLFPEVTKTKVFLYKVPTVRSDLFGLGAVFFDLLTGGKSAERFYEALRSVDVPFNPEEDERRPAVEGGRRWSSEDIVREFEEYRRSGGARVGTSVGPALLNMFQLFRREDDFAPARVVSIIVRLMGAYLDDSYWNTDPRKRSVPKHLLNIDAAALPISWALEDIKSLATSKVFDLHEGWLQKGMNNLLFRPQEAQEYLELVVKSHGAFVDEAADGRGDGEGLQKQESGKTNLRERVRGLGSMFGFKV